MSYVYVAESGKGYCKIGKSDDPERRMREIENATGLGITRFEHFECIGNPHDTEKLCHESARQLNVFGEWFAVEFDHACEIVKECVPAVPLDADVIDGKKLMPQWQPTTEQRKHVEEMAAKYGTTITGYMRQLVNDDMKRVKK